MVADTTPAAEKRQHEIFMSMSGERRLLLAMAFSDQIRDIAIEGLRRRHPLASEEDLKAIYFKEMLGVEIPHRTQRLGWLKE
jgi:hypothetical protein